MKFTVGDYDRTRELVIDPVLQYSTYFGAEGYDASAAVVTDTNGDILMTGVTTSPRLPTVQTAQAEFGEIPMLSSRDSRERVRLSGLHISVARRVTQVVTSPLTVRAMRMSWAARCQRTFQRRALPIRN